MKFLFFRQIVQTDLIITIGDKRVFFNQEIDDTSDEGVTVKWELSCGSARLYLVSFFDEKCTHFNLQYNDGSHEDKGILNDADEAFRMIEDFFSEVR